MADEHSTESPRPSRKIFSPELIESVLRDYQTGLSARSVAELHDLYPYDVTKILRQSGVVVRGAWIRLTDNEKQSIRNRYLAGEGAIAIAKSLGIHRVGVYRALRETGVAIRSNSEAQRKYPLNETVFNDSESNEEAAYFAGLLMADGCVGRRGNRNDWSVTLSLTWSDRDIIDRFCAFLGTDRPYRKEKPGGYEGTGASCRIQINSQRIVESLARYGVVPNKSGREAVSVLENNRHFWRGMVDGDGWLCLTCGRHPVIGLTGSLRIVEQFLLFVCAAIGKVSTKPERNGSIWKAVIGSANGYRLIKHLYGDALVSLNRKATKARHILEKCSRFEIWEGFHDWSALTAEQLLLLRQEHGTWIAVAQSLGMPSGSIGSVLSRVGISPKRIRSQRKNK